MIAVPVCLALGGAERRLHRPTGPQHLLDVPERAQRAVGDGQRRWRRLREGEGAPLLHPHPIGTDDLDEAGDEVVGLVAARGGAARILLVALAEDVGLQRAELAHPALDLPADLPLRLAHRELLDETGEPGIGDLVGLLDECDLRPALDRLDGAVGRRDVAQLQPGERLLEVEIILDGHDPGESDDADRSGRQLPAPQDVHELLAHRRLARHAEHRAGEVGRLEVRHEVAEPQLAGELLVAVAEHEGGDAVGHQHRVAGHRIQVIARDVVDVAIGADLAPTAEDERLHTLVTDHRLQPGPAVFEDRTRDHGHDGHRIAPSQTRVRGSSASRRVSPSRFSASNTASSTTPGASVMWGAMFR